MLLCVEKSLYITSLYHYTMRARVIPGVSVEVVKEIVPQQLYPSGIVGLIGTAEKGQNNKINGFTSYKEIKTEYGEPENGTLVKEAKLAFLNGVFQVFAVKVGGAASGTAMANLRAEKRPNKNIVKLVSQREGEEGNSLRIRVKKGGTQNYATLEVVDEAHPERTETHGDLVMDPSSERYLVNWLNTNSRLVKAEAIGEPVLDNPPMEQDVRFEGGRAGKPDIKNYEQALEQLELEPNIDVVYGCDEGDPQIHNLVKAHCENMSTSSEAGALGPRIGIGSVAKGDTLEDIVRKNQIVSDRFILVAPYGFAAAVAGLISKLNYFESPTFKPLNLVESFEDRYTPSQQMKLLESGVIPIDLIRGRGIVVVKGITSSKEQISVQRVADRGIRGVKNIADNFIGTLNNARGRMALRERITEFFVAMEKEGSIVPSTDATKPAYLIDVYSSQDDFSKGIVRVDIGMRPVRAMDYIYATINVQAF
jgi:hypothetical protein